MPDSVSSLHSTSHIQSPRPPSTIALIHAVGGLGVESGIEKLFGCGDTDVGEPGFVPAVVDLEEAVAAFVGDANGIGVELAFAASNLDGAFLEVIGPLLANNLCDLSR